MIDLFYYSPTVMLASFFALICLFAAEGVYACVTMLNYRFREKRVLVGEGILLVHIAMLAMVVVTVITNSRYGVVSLGGFEVALYVTGAVGAIYFGVLAVLSVRYSLTAFCAVVMTLPLFAEVLNKGYILFLAVSVVLLFYRAFNLIGGTLHRQKNELNAFSVMDGLNALPCGVLFCDLSGYVFLINAKMAELALRFMETEPKNGLLFWEHLQNSGLHGVETQVVEGDVLLRTPNSAWRFSRRQLLSDGVRHIEITAVDVTESIGAFYALEEENEKLERQSAEIQKLTENIEALEREREYSRIRSRVHDVLGQRLTAIQKLMQSGDEPDYNMLLFLSEDAIENIKQRRGGNAKELFGEIYHYFYRIGLEIELADPLPEEEHIAFLFLSVLREAATNAVKHAAATKLYAKIDESEDGYRIEITNNGERPKKSLIEGGGLFGIRNRVENLGGVLKVELIPEFCLIITVGRGTNA